MAASKSSTILKISHSFSKKSNTGIQNMASIEFNNIFDAVIDNKDEANELQIRADLMSAIRDIYEDTDCGKSKFAKKVGLTQSKTRSLLNGQIDKFSIDILVTCLFRLGFRFKPVYKNHQLTITVQTV